MPTDPPVFHASDSGPRIVLSPGQSRLVICLLGALSVLTPLSIDMYLPAFTQMAKELQTASAIISLSVSTYFVGLAAGQVIYGPILDRFGRKIPLTIGLVIFIAASVACARATNVQALLILRFIQGFCGCVAQVAAVAMVRDFFPARESARVFSLLFLFIGVSPLLAPSLGGLLVLVMSWKAIFYLLGGIALIVAALIVIFLPEGHPPDPTISLRPKPIVTEFLAIGQHPQFLTYTLAGAFSFAGLFAFVAGSPIVFMEGFHLSPQAYSGVFALLTGGFIGASQVNVFLLRKFSSEVIFAGGVAVQAVTGILFAVGACGRWYNFPTTLALFFTILACAGLSNPNASALALMPFRRNAGSASALMGFLQLSIGATISTGIGICATRSSLPIIIILGVTSVMGATALAIGRRKIADFAARHPSDFPLAEAEHVDS